MTRTAIVGAGPSAFYTADQLLAAGEPQGRPRVKLVRVPEMLAVCKGANGAGGLH